MTDTKPKPPPLPSWWGIQEGAQEALTAVALYRREQTSTSNIARLRSVVETDKRYVTNAANALKEARTPQGRQDAKDQLKREQQYLRRSRADLKLAEGSISYNSQVPDDELLEFVLGLPGVFGVRVSLDGNPVIGIRTRYNLNRVRYDMGDFEIQLQKDDAHSSQLWRIDMIRAGRAPSTFGLYYGGEFCFGVRADEIVRLARGAQIGELLHLMIACMNDVNAEHATHKTLNEYYQVVGKPDPAPRAGVCRPYSTEPSLKQKTSKAMSAATSRRSS